jgi:hypothetical protein
MKKNQEIELSILPGTYTIHRLNPGSELPVISQGFYSITYTDDEISVVCSDEVEIPSTDRSPGWKCLKLAGTLELDQVGILHDLSRPLKNAGISIFVVSTYDTDYLLIPGSLFEKAIKVLSATYIIKIE